MLRRNGATLPVPCRQHKIRGGGACHCRCARHALHEQAIDESSLQHPWRFSSVVRSAWRPAQSPDHILSCAPAATASPTIAGPVAPEGRHQGPTPEWKAPAPPAPGMVRGLTMRSVTLSRSTSNQPLRPSVPSTMRSAGSTAAASTIRSTILPSAAWRSQRQPATWADPMAARPPAGRRETGSPGQPHSRPGSPGTCPPAVQRRGPVWPQPETVSG